MGFYENCIHCFKLLNGLLGIFYAKPFGYIHPTNLSFYSNFRQFDIREPHNCTREEKVCLIDLQNHIGSSAEAKCVALNPRRPEQLAVGASDAYARIYDRRMIKLCPVRASKHNHSLSPH